MAPTRCPKSRYTGGNPLQNVDPLGLTWWNPLSWSADTLDNISMVTSGIALVLTATGVGAPVATVLEGVSVAASLGASYKHGMDGDVVGMGASMLGAVPGLSAIAGDTVRVGTRSVAKLTGTLARKTGGSAARLGDRMSLVGDALWGPQAISTLGWSWWEAAC